MDAEHTIIVERLRDLLKFFKKNKKVLKKVIADFDKKHLYFIARMKDLEEQITQASEDISIITRQKEEIRDKITSEILLLVLTPGEIIESQVQILPIKLMVSESDLKEFNNDEFLLVSESFMKEASEYLEKRPHNGFGKKRTNALSKLIKEYRDIMTEPLFREQIKKTSGIMVVTILAELEMWFTGIDNWIKAIERDYSEMCGEYEAIRRGKRG